MEATGFKPNVFHQILKQCKLAARIIITFQVMTLAGMSPGYPDPVGPVTKRCQEKLGAHSSGTGDPDDPEVRRIFHTAHTGQIRCPIAAPAA